MTCECNPYPSRISEQLVLEGYRHWSAGVITGDYSHWENAWNIYATKLGSQQGRMALDALTSFTKTLEVCAACPLKTSPIGCHSLCRDEVLILGLLSGIQHDDETAVTLCLDGLTCPTRCDDVLYAAEILATTLRALDNHLLPITAQTIKAILTQDNSTATLQ